MGCQRCLRNGKDYCIADDVCIQRATKGCNGPDDQVTGDFSFSKEDGGISMDCLQALLATSNQPQCVEIPAAAFTCSDSGFETCCPGTEIGDRCGDCCAQYLWIVTPLLLI